MFSIQLELNGEVMASDRWHENLWRDITCHCLYNQAKWKWRVQPLESQQGPLSVCVFFSGIALQQLIHLYSVYLFFFFQQEEFYVYMYHSAVFLAQLLELL